MQEMTMVEKVARALDPSIWQAADDGMINPTGKQMSLDAARRAIEAMREPTDNVRRAGWHELRKNNDIQTRLGNSLVGVETPVYTAMIDAALEEAPCPTPK